MTTIRDLAVGTRIQWPHASWPVPSGVHTRINPKENLGFYLRSGIGEKWCNVITAEYSPYQDFTVIEDKKPFVKDDKSKPRFDLIPQDGLLALAQVMTLGAAEYGDENWRKCTDRKRYIAAAYRHLNAIARGIEKDPKSQEHHGAHLAACALFLCELKP